MEALNIIKKIFLLMHLCIVRMNIKSIFPVFSCLIVFSSCSGNKFLNRKYTHGKIIEQARSLKHNTIFPDSTKNLASTNSIELQHNFETSPIKNENNLIKDKVNSIIKKDSIFVFNRRGKDKTVIVKNNLPNVIIQIDKKGNRVKTKSLTPVQAEKIKTNYETKIKIVSISALCFSLIPFAGLILSFTAKKLINQNKETNPFKNINKYRTISNIALGVSIIPSLIGLLIAAFIVFAFLVFAFG